MTPPLPRLALGLALVISSSPALAQSKPDESAPKAAPAAGPFGDPARFTRMGGWGGFGSGMAQFGMAKAMLLMSPAVQKELKLNEAQIKALRDRGEELRKKGETMFRNQAQGQNQGQGQGQPANPPDPNNPGAPGGPPPPVPPGGPPNPLAMLEMVQTLAREGEDSLAKVLDRKQLVRLNQIALQMEGVAALARPEVAESIYLSPEQVEQIQEILNGAKGQQMALMLRQGFAMRAGRGPNAAGPQTKAGEPAKAAAQDEDPEAQSRRRQAQRERARAEFTKFRESSDKIQDETTEKILRVLAKKQRERFDKLLGEPFDPTKLAAPGGGFGGPIRPDAPASADAASKTNDAAKAAPARSSRLRDMRSKGESKP